MGGLFTNPQHLVFVEEYWVDNTTPCAWSGCIQHYETKNVRDFHKSYARLTRNFNMLVATTTLLHDIANSIEVEIITTNKDFIKYANNKIRLYNPNLPKSNSASQQRIIGDLWVDLKRLTGSFRAPYPGKEEKFCQALKERAKGLREARLYSIVSDGGHC